MCCLNALYRRDTAEAPAALPIRPKVNFDDSVFDDELASARRRAERAITEETFFDSKGTRVAKSSMKPLDGIDEEVCCCFIHTSIFLLSIFAFCWPLIKHSNRINKL